ncbi:MAG: hypothetical protein HYX75_04545 [Acidobacteria bacterium]|nr:hypothetical protein [Acidobacteriota bacterium]
MKSIAKLRERYPALPPELAELMREASEIELSYRGVYLRLYGPEACEEMDEAYSVSKRIPGAVTVGDNGGGEALVVMPDGAIHRIGYGALAVDALRFVAASLEALLVQASVPANAVGNCCS